MAALMIASRISVAIVLSLAGLVKLTHWSAFPAIVSRLVPLRGKIAVAAAYGIVTCEFGIGVCMLANRGATLAAVAAAILLASFAVVLGINIFSGKKGQSCGCFGPRSRISWAHVLRNFGLAAVALAAVSSRTAGLLLIAALVVFTLSFMPRFHLSSESRSVTSSAPSTLP